MNILFGTFLAVTLMPPMLLSVLALLGREQRVVRRVAVARTLPRKPRRPAGDVS